MRLCAGTEPSASCALRKCLPLSYTLDLSLLSALKHGLTKPLRLAVTCNPPDAVSSGDGIACYQAWFTEFLENILRNSAVGTPLRAHFGRGLMYYKCRQKACMTLYPAGFGCSFQHTQRTVDCYPSSEFILK